MDSRVVQVAEDFGGGKVSQSPSDESGVSGRGVGQAERHLDKLVLSKRRRERRLLPVCKLDRDGVEGTCSIEGGEDAAPGEERQIVGDVSPIFYFPCQMSESFKGQAIHCDQLQLGYWDAGVVVRSWPQGDLRPHIQ